MSTRFPVTEFAYYRKEAKTRQKKQEKNCFKVQAQVPTCALGTPGGQDIIIILLLLSLQNLNINNADSRTGFLGTSNALRGKFTVLLQ